MLKFVPKGYSGKATYIVGCDEVGRGCLAGPVVAASVVLEAGIRKQELWFSDVKDSKLLPASAREYLATLIKKISIAWSVGVVSPRVIDAINIHHASLRAMRLSVNRITSVIASKESLLQAEARLTKQSKSSYEIAEISLNVLNDMFFLFVDGKFPIPNISIPQQAIVDGDAKIFAVACASIIAKVYRDSLMQKLHVKLPQYNFAKHKGYATPEHQQAILKYGLSNHHRRSFRSKYV